MFFLKHERAGSDEQEIILMWPYVYLKVEERNFNCYYSQLQKVMKGHYDIE